MYLYIPRTRTCAAYAQFYIVKFILV